MQRNVQFKRAEETQIWLIWLFRGRIRLYSLLAFFAARAHCVCLSVCVCWICAGLVCKINSCCCCTLPAVVSHFPECDAECLQHRYILVNVGTYACTNLMLKGTALRRMVMSLPARNWATSHDSIHEVLVNKKSSAMLVFIFFSTEENLVSFLCCCFANVLPSHFTESKNVPSVPVYFVC